MESEVLLKGQGEEFWPPCWRGWESEVRAVLGAGGMLIRSDRS